MISILKLALVAALVYGGLTSGATLITEAKVAATESTIDCAAIDQSKSMSRKAMLACL